MKNKLRSSRASWSRHVNGCPKAERHQYSDYSDVLDAMFSVAQCPKVTNFDAFEQIRTKLDLKMHKKWVNLD